jgi:hypothetical protein
MEIGRLAMSALPKPQQTKKAARLARLKSERELLSGLTAIGRAIRRKIVFTALGSPQRCGLWPNTAAEDWRDE